MRPRKIDDQQLMKSLLGVFRNKGYTGSSMNDLALATGLKKASLYHRFPQGKEQMAREVLESVHEWEIANIVSILKDDKGSFEDRIDLVIQNIKELYDGGNERCIWRSIGLEGSSDEVANLIAESMKTWIEAFTNFGIEIQLSEQEAKDRAISSLVLVQGSLIVAKGMSDLSMFHQALVELKEKYIE